MKNKMLFLKGLPGSGKSTYANQYLQTNKKAVRVNKDDLRIALFSKSFKQKNEGTVIDVERQTVKFLLSKGKDVIIDNTHFNPIHEAYYRTMATEAEADFEAVFLDVPVDECIKRDNMRRLKGERFVGRDVILNMAWTNGIYRSPSNCVVSDMDGTLADCTGRRQYVRNLNNDPEFKTDWGKFFALVETDKVNEDIKAKLKQAKGTGLDVIIVSARPEYIRSKTENWLTKHEIPYDRLIMRGSSDHRPDEIVKKEMLDNFLDKSKIQDWYDDRPKVIRMLRDNGINVTDVGTGEEF